MRLIPTIQYALLFVVLLQSPFLLNAQQKVLVPNYWQSTEESSINQKSITRQIFPTEYQVFSLDFQSIQKDLAGAPFRFTSEAGKVALFLNLPTPQGTFETFRIFQTALLPPGLADKFPGIRTFTGQGVEDPSATLQLDITHKGLHAMVLHGQQGTYYIDPYGKGSNTHYQVYARKAFSAQKGFSCAYEQVNDLEKLPVFDNDEKVIGDCQFRLYELALACTGEYTIFHGGTVMDAMAAMTTTINRVNGIYEKEIGVTFQFVPNNDQLIFLNPATDPYDNEDGFTMLAQNQATCDNIIGAANYDIGHVFSTGGGGIASLNSACSNSSKAKGVTGLPQPVGDPFDVDYVCHEIGHQFGGRHTQNNDCNRDGSSSYEPGSASTIMGYAGICLPNVQSNSDPYFHVHSIILMRGFSSGIGGLCAEVINMSNNAPTSNAGEDFTIPHSTPFVLTGAGTDPDGDLITYNWEQYDKEIAVMPPQPTNTQGPAFRSLEATTEPSRYFPNLEAVINNSAPTWEVLASVSRTYTFKLSVRDNNMQGGCIDDDDMLVTVQAAAGPFLVSSPNTAVNWTGNTTELVSWDVANTDAGIIGAPTVDILLSTDGGFTYPTLLAEDVPNDGSFEVTVPNTPTSSARIMVRGHNHIFYDISDTDFSIQQGNPPLTLTTEVINVACFGDSTGTAVVVPNGGSGNYTFLWSTGETSAVINNLPAGSYEVTVDDGQTSVSTIATIAQPAPLVLILSSSNATNGNNGTAEVMVSGGTSPYSILWSTGETTNLIENLVPGTYIVEVTDDNDCLATDSVSISEGALSLIVETTPVSCHGANDGQAEAIASGGTGVYSYTWNTGDTTALISDLGPGNYSVTVDDGAQTLADTIQVTEPDSLVLSISSTNATNGNNGTAEVSISGGIPSYSVLWSTGADTTYIEGLAPGMYTVEVTDSIGCIALDSVLIQDVSSDCLPPIVVDISTTNTTATITWDTVPNAERYRIRYRIPGVTGWQNAPLSNNSNSLTLTGLIPNTTYEFQIQTRCLNGDLSDWSPTIYTFTTLEDPVETCSTWGPASTSTTEATATIEISPEPGAIQYRLRYRKTGTTDWNLAAATDLTVQLFGLEPGTEYEYNTITRCPEGWTNWSAQTYTFITVDGPIAACDSWAPTSTNTTANTASISFLLESGAAKYRMRYRPTGTQTWLGAITLIPPIELEDLLPATTYEYQTGTLCLSGWTEWSTTTYTFQTEEDNLGGNQLTHRSNTSSVTPTAIDFLLSPNPASVQLTLSLQDPSGKQAVITDFSGKVLIRQALRNSQTFFNLHDLPAGIYFLTVQSEDGNRLTKRFVKGL